jgi:hypothetical protein
LSGLERRIRLIRVIQPGRIGSQGSDSKARVGCCQIVILASQKPRGKSLRQIVRWYRPKLVDARNTVQKAEGDLEDMLNDPESVSEDADSVIKRVAGYTGCFCPGLPPDESAASESVDSGPMAATHQALG